MGFEENTRHKSEDRLVSSGFQPRMKQNALSRECVLTAKLTAMSQESPVLLLRNTSLEAEVPWELGWRSLGCKALLEVPGGGLLVKFAVRLLSKEEISPIQIRSSRTTRDLSHLVRLYSILCRLRTH